MKLTDWTPTVPGSAVRRYPDGRWAAIALGRDFYVREIRSQRGVVVNHAASFDQAKDYADTVLRDLGHELPESADGR